MRIPLITTVYDTDGTILRYEVSIDTQLEDGRISANLRVSPEAFDLAPLEAEITRLLSNFITTEEE